MSGRPELRAESLSPEQALECHPRPSTPDPLALSHPRPCAGCRWGRGASLGISGPVATLTGRGFPQQVSWAVGDLATGSLGFPDRCFSGFAFEEPATQHFEGLPCPMPVPRPSLARSPPHPTPPLAPTSFPLAWASVAKESSTGTGRYIALDPGMIPDSAETLEGTEPGVTLKSKPPITTCLNRARTLWAHPPNPQPAFCQQIKFSQ